MDRRVDVHPIWSDLNERLHPLNLSQLAASRKCRLHDTTDHGEMDCLVFLLRVDMALRGKFSFSQIHEPAVFVHSEEDFLVFKEDIIRELENTCGKHYWCLAHSLIYSQSTCPSCQDTIDSVKFQLGWYEEISAGGGKHFFQLRDWTPKNEEDDVVDSNVQDNQVDEPSHIISRVGEVDKKIEETIKLIQEGEETISKGKDSTEILIESDPDASSGKGEGMFESFKNFVTRTTQQGMELGNRTPVRDLLLPNWCRIHNASHSELSCSLCTVALEQVEKRISGALK